jgi:methyl-accepting chemotaxis protein
MLKMMSVMSDRMVGKVTNMVGEINGRVGEISQTINSHSQSIARLEAQIELIADIVKREEKSFKVSRWPILMNTTW